MTSMACAGVSPPPNKPAQRAGDGIQVELAQRRSNKHRLTRPRMTKLLAFLNQAVEALYILSVQANRNDL